jgi:hypothetical protein
VRISFYRAALINLAGNLLLLVSVPEMSTAALRTSIETRLVLFVCCWLASVPDVPLGSAGALADATKAWVPT